MGSNFDAIVIGGGIGGLCCAGELVLSGANVLLVPEAKEVGFAVRPHVVDGNTGIMQAPTYMVGWDGGWWPSLARRLNANIIAPFGFNSVGYDLALAGTGKVSTIPQAAISGSGLNSMLANLAGSIEPSLSEAFGPESERMLHNALSIPHAELMGMDRVSLAEWLEDQKADPLLTAVMFMLCGALLGSSGSFCRDQVSVFGMVAAFRACFCGEATFGFVYPDNRKGLAVPIAEAIEAHGGTIMRGRKVVKLDTDHGRVGKVVLSDGVEVSAPMVALACSNGRTSALLNPRPPEIEAALAYSETVLHKDYHLWAVMDRPVLPPEFKRWVGVLEPDGTLAAWLGPCHAMTPWAVEPGKQFVLIGACFPDSEVKAGQYGTEDEIFTRLHNITESFYPGFKDATGVTDTTSHDPGHLWHQPLHAGPKLPRTIPSVEGLWFVGEGSTPVCGVYMEAAASAGILGARQMVEVRRGA